MAQLISHGPLIAVKLWVPRSVKSDIEPIDTMAEISTAYPQTFIQEGVATSLGLEPSGTIHITTATKPRFKAHLFRIRVIFSGRAFEVAVAEIPYMLRPNARIKCLIGRDILQYCMFTYDGPSDTFTLDFKF